MRLESYEAGGLIVKGELRPEGLITFRQAMGSFPEGAHVRIRVDVERPSRSSQQNRFWHGIVVKAFAEHCGEEFDDMKDILALHLLPKEVTDMTTGEVIKVPGHTSDLNTKEFNDLIERAQRLGAEMGIDIPNPGEVAA